MVCLQSDKLVNKRSTFHREVRANKNLTVGFSLMKVLNNKNCNSTKPWLV